MVINENVTKSRKILTVLFIIVWQNHLIIILEEVQDVCA